MQGNYTLLQKNPKGTPNPNELPKQPNEQSTQTTTLRQRTLIDYIWELCCQLRPIDDVKIQEELPY